MTTIKQVNRKLAKLGMEEFLVKGNNYFYFAGGTSPCWPSSMVIANSINAFSVEGWVEEYLNLRNDYESTR